MPTANTPSESDDLLGDLKLPESMREELRKPLGRIFQGESVLNAISRARAVVSVGDFCTADLLKRSHPPQIAVFDLKQKRSPDESLLPLLKALPYRWARVPNPAAHITRELWRAVREAFKSRERVAIEVEGEEDLATLACIALAPVGAAVLYGMPDRGVVVVNVDKKSKRTVRSILKRMEASHGS